MYVDRDCDCGDRRVHLRRFRSHPLDPQGHLGNWPDYRCFCFFKCGDYLCGRFLLPHGHPEFAGHLLPGNVLRREILSYREAVSGGHIDEAHQQLQVGLGDHEPSEDDEALAAKIDAQGIDDGPYDPQGPRHGINKSVYTSASNDSPEPGSTSGSSTARDV